MRTQFLKQKMQKEQLDVLISFAPQTRIWANNINSSEGILFIEKNQTYLFVDNRYFEYAQKNAENAEVVLYNKDNIEKFIKEHLSKYKNIGIEEEYITFTESKKINTWFPDSKQTQVSAHEMRMIKTKDEIKNIKTACTIALKALEKVVPYIKPGVTEKYIDAKLEYHIRNLGAEKGSFDAIVASGVRGSLPHGRASDKVIQEGELITIDFGAIYNGYCSDITRTFHVGKVTNPELLKIEEVLREAQRLGKAIIKPGVTTFEVDETCRKYIESKGYGDYFIHSTGHGLGIDVHEKPYVSSNKKLSVTLQEGMVITVEPGIYINGLGGIRVEDDMLVTNENSECLSSYKI